MKTKLKILHLEDSTTDAYLIERELRKANIQLEILVVDNKTAFEMALIKFAPDIIISDHTLPSFNSMEAIKIIKQQGMKTPFILVSATVTDEYAVDIMKAGADDYILKDRMNRLPQAVLNAIEKNSMKIAEESIIDELKRSQAHLKEAQAIAKLGSWETDLQTFKVTWSAEIHHIFETDPKTFQVTHEAFLNFTHPDDRINVNTAFENSFNSQNVNSVEHRIITANGKVKQIIEKWKIFKDAQGRLFRAIGTCQDITERKSTEERLIDSELKLKEAQALGHISNWEVDFVTNINTWSDEFYIIFGLKREDVTPSIESFLALLHPDDRSYVSERVAKNFKTLEAGSLNSRFIKKDGSIGYIYSEWKFEFDKKNKPLRLYGILQDITQSKQAEDALRKSELNLQTIFENTTEGFTFYDTNGIVKTFNTKAAQNILLNTGKHIKIGSNIYDFVHTSRKKIFQDNFSKVLAGETIQYDHSYELKNGDKNWFNFTINPAYNKAGVIEGACITTADITLRKKAEEERNMFFDLSIDMIGITGDDGHFHKVNPSFEKILGYSPAEFYAKPFLEFVHPDDIPATILEVEKLAKGIPTISFTNRNRCKDGNYKWLEWSAEPFGRKLYCIARDITERKKVQNLLQESETRFRSLIENSTDMLTLISAEGIMDYISPSVERTFGYSNKENKTRNAMEVVHPDDLATAQGQLKNVFENPGISFLSVIRNRKKDGTYIWVEGVITNMLHVPGINHIVANFRDISERKLAEESLQQSQTNLQAVLENTDAVIYSLDTELRYIAFNTPLYNSLKQIYGLDVKVGDNSVSFLENIAPEEAKGWKEIYSKALKGESIKFEKEFNIGGLNNFSSFTFYPIWHNNTIVGISCFIYDITKQKKEQQQKEKMMEDIVMRNKNLEQFSYIVSHNLRSPVANILGLTNILQGENNSIETVTFCTKGLDQAAKKLDDVIKDLNHILQVRTHLTERKELVSFSKLTSDIQISIEAMIAKGKATIQCDFSEVAEMMAIKSYLYSIFYNLISNSIKYRQHNVPLLIEIKSQVINNKIILLFKDNGLGIDLETQNESVFGLYKRFHIHNAEGKGMGLFMVKTQVESIGGSITIQSEVNKGTEFRIEFLI